VLEKGRIITSGDSETVLASYIKMNREQFLGIDYSKQDSLPGNEHIRINRVELVPAYKDQNQVIDIRTTLDINFDFTYLDGEPGQLMVNLQVFSSSDELIFELASENYTL
jgi:hypothetical protein